MYCTAAQPRFQINYCVFLETILQPTSINTSCSVADIIRELFTAWKIPERVPINMSSDIPVESRKQ
jgi:hypothetical protein